MSYAVDAADARTDIASAGAAVTFTSGSGTHDAATDTWSAASTVTVPGYAVETRGNPLAYKALSLQQLDVRTLLFAPSTYGLQPVLGAIVTWNSAAYTVQSVDQVSPDGAAIVSKVVVAR